MIARCADAVRGRRQARFQGFGLEVVPESRLQAEQARGGMKLVGGQVATMKSSFCRWALRDGLGWSRGKGGGPAKR